MHGPSNSPFKNNKSGKEQGALVPRSDHQFILPCAVMVEAAHIKGGDNYHGRTVTQILGQLH